VTPDRLTNQATDDNFCIIVQEVRNEVKKKQMQAVLESDLQCVLTSENVLISNGVNNHQNNRNSTGLNYEDLMRKQAVRQHVEAYQDERKQRVACFLDSLENQRTEYLERMCKVEG
jgi:hypothetical protein